MKKKCVLLLSGGLDSVTTLVFALSEGYEVVAISFEYGQKHAIELKLAAENAKKYGISHKIFNMREIFSGFNSALIANDTGGISHNAFPSTYVPARNTIFLSIASGFAESIGVSEIFIGANAIDYSGYPDCRPEFIKSFEKTINLGTSFEGKFEIKTPLLDMTKAEIIQLGTRLSVDYSKTISCYDPIEEKPCGNCGSCKIRAEGFSAAGVIDPSIS